MPSLKAGTSIVWLAALTPSRAQSPRQETCRGCSISYPNFNLCSHLLLSHTSLKEPKGLGVRRSECGGQLAWPLSCFLKSPLQHAWQCPTALASCMCLGREGFERVTVHLMQQSEGPRWCESFSIIALSLPRSPQSQPLLLESR